MSRIHLRDDGDYDWIPAVPESTVAARQWQQVKGRRERYQWRLPFKCVSCEQAISFWDAFDLSKKGSRGKKEQEVQGSVIIGAQIRNLTESVNPALQHKTHEGKRLHIMTWQVFPQTMRGPGCPQCQHLMLRHNFIDLTQDVLLLAQESGGK